MWQDTREIRAGRDWEDQIADGLRCTQMVLQRSRLPNLRIGLFHCLIPQHATLAFDSSTDSRSRITHSSTG